MPMDIKGYWHDQPVCQVKNLESSSTGQNEPYENLNLRSTGCMGNHPQGQC